MPALKPRFPGVCLHDGLPSHLIHEVADTFFGASQSAESLAECGFLAGSFGGGPFDGGCRVRGVGCPRSPRAELIQPFVAARRAYASKRGPLIAPNLPLPSPQETKYRLCAL
jgi:hypothetical protein